MVSKVILPANPALERDAVNGVVFSSTFCAPRPSAPRWTSPHTVFSVASVFGERHLPDCGLVTRKGSARVDQGQRSPSLELGSSKTCRTKRSKPLRQT